MINIKKLAALTMATVLAVGCLAGCGSSGGGKSADGKVKLAFGIWDKNQQPTMQKMCDAYTAANPNVTFEIQITPYKGQEYWTKLDASMNGGTAPDVFWINSMNVEKYVEGGMVEPLDDSIKSSNFDLSQFPQSLKDTYNIGGKQYAIPKDFDTTAVWYNKEIFDNAGVEYPKAGWTFDEMVEMAKKLENKEKGIYGITAPLDSQSYYYNTVFANGGHILNKDRNGFGYNLPETIEGIQCWVDLIEQGLAPSISVTTETTSDALFEAGNLAMVWAGSYMTPEYLLNETVKDKIDLVELPTFNGKEGNVINGLGYSVFSKSKNKEEAIKFALWMGSEEAMNIQGESGVVISARNDAQHLFSDNHPEINLKAYTDKASIAMPFPGCKVSNQLFDLENNYLKLAFDGQKTVAEACEELQKEATALLTK